MLIRFAVSEELENWDNLILRNADNGNIFQSYEMTNFKKLSGWNPIFLVVENNPEKQNIYISVQEKKVPFLGKIWYISKGPGVKSVLQLKEFLPYLQNLAAGNKVFAVKIEPELLKTEQALSELNQLGLQKVRPIQPNYSTILLDISGLEEEILSSMPRKGAKYSINRARRDGVTVKRVESTDENCRFFYDLLAETARESGFNIRTFDYHKEFWQIFAKKGFGQLFFAYFEGQIVAAAYAFSYGEKSTYKDGASIRERKAYGASHLLQWEVILWAREKGAKIHDLCGTPPSDQIHNKNHFLHGVGQFKTSFSRQITDYIGAYDLPIDQKKYKIWSKFGERAVLKIHRKIHKENWY